MKRLLLALFLLSPAAPLFAADDGGDPGYIPDYQELVREGYGPHSQEIQNRPEYGSTVIDIHRPYTVHAAPKPTQAYYGKGFTIYYGYTTVLAAEGDADSIYAFGYPLTYFRQLTPASITDVNLTRYRQEVRDTHNAAGNARAQVQADHGNAITTVQPVIPTPATGAKPAQ
jgi:hypothetical protein